MEPVLSKPYDWFSQCLWLGLVLIPHQILLTVKLMCLNVMMSCEPVIWSVHSNQILSLYFLPPPNPPPSVSQNTADKTAINIAKDYLDEHQTDFKTNKQLNKQKYFPMTDSDCFKSPGQHPR